MCNVGIFMTLVYSSPSILRAQRTLRNLLNMYGGLFSTEAWVTLVYSELEAYSEPCQYVWWKILFTNLCNRSIFRPVAYSESQTYQNIYIKFRIYIFRDIFRILPNIYREIFYSKPFVTLTHSEPWSGPAKWISKWEGRGHGTLKSIAGHHSWPTRKIFEF